MKRKVRYNIKTDTGEQVSQRNRWTVAILNEPREIDRIEQRLYGELGPISEVNIGYDYAVPSTGLRCKIFSFSTERRLEDSDKIFRSKEFKRDRDLRERAEDEYEVYVRNLTSD